MEIDLIINMIIAVDIPIKTFIVPMNTHYAAYESLKYQI